MHNDLLDKLGQIMTKEVCPKSEVDSQWGKMFQTDQTETKMDKTLPATLLN